MHLIIYFDMALFQWVFIIVISAVGVLMSHWYLIRFPPAVNLTQCVSIFCSLMIHNDWMYIAFNLNGICYQYTNTIFWYLHTSPNLAIFSEFITHPFFQHFLHFPLYQISVFECLSNCIAGETICNGVKGYRFFLHIIFDNYVLLNFVGSNGLFYFCSNFWFDCAEVVCNISLPSCRVSFFLPGDI